MPEQDIDMEAGHEGFLPNIMSYFEDATYKHYFSTKTFKNYPCAHRQWRHDGNCALVHGYSRSFTFLFEAYQPDKCGFVVDYGDLDWLKQHLEYMYDHTLLLCEDDPQLNTFKLLERAGACRVRHHPHGLGVGMEDTATALCIFADQELRKRTKGRCWVVAVESRENDKNSSIFYNPNRGFKGWL